MKKFFLSSLLLWMISFTISYAAYRFWLPGWLKEQLEQKLSKDGVTVQIQNLKLEVLSQWPLILQTELQGVSYQKPAEQELIIEKIIFKFNSGPLEHFFDSPKRLHPEFFLSVQKPTFKMYIRSSTSTSPPQPPSDESSSWFLSMNSLKDLRQAIPDLADLTVKVEVTNLRADISGISNWTEPLQLKETSFQAALQSLDQPLQVQVQTQLKVPHPLTNFAIPLSLSVQAEWVDSRIKLHRSQFKILALESQLQGSVSWLEKNMDLHVQADYKDLRQLPPLPLPLTVQPLAGSLALETHLQGSWSSPQISGRVKLSQVAIQMKAETPSYSAQGPLSLQLDAEFSKNQQSPFEIKQLYWSFQGSNMQLKAPPWFAKEVGVPLHSSGVLTYQNQLYLRQSESQIAQIKIQMAGAIDIQNKAQLPANLQVSIPASDLKGLDQALPFLKEKSLPVQIAGRLQMKADVQGPLLDFKNLKVNVDSLVLDSFSSPLQWSANDVKAQGTVSGSLKTSLLWHQQALQKATVDTRFNLSAMDITYKNWIQKNKQENLQISLQAEQIQKNLRLKNLKVDTPAGSLTLQGLAPTALDNPMDLQLQTNNWNLQKLKSLLPSFKNLIPEGEFQVQLRAQGKMDSKNWMQSPLQISGDSFLKIKKYSWTPAPTVPPPAGTPPPAPTPPMAFIADSALIRGLQFKTQLMCDQATLAGMTLEGLSGQFQIQKSTLTGSTSIKKIFSGSTTLSRLQVPLTLPDPQIQFTVATQKIDLQQALQQFLPTYKDWAQGHADIQAQGTTRLPSSPQFLQDLKADGSLKLQNAVVQTFKVTEMISSLKKLNIPDRGPLQMNITSQWSLKNKILDLKNFQGVSARKEELLLAGTAGLDGQLNLQGKLFLVDVGVGGSFFEANKDASQRLEIPLLVKGSAFKPEFSMVQGTLEKMLGKTVDYEKKKLTDKVVQDVKKNVSEQIKNKVQDFFK